MTSDAPSIASGGAARRPVAPGTILIVVGFSVFVAADDLTDAAKKAVAAAG